MADNTITIAGNLTDEPKLQTTPGGTDVAHFTVAVTERRRDGDTWKDGETSFIRCTVWREPAANAAESLSKGDRVLVTGRIRQRSWQTEDGEKRSSIEVDVDELGASLKWGRVEVQRTRRSEDS